MQLAFMMTCVMAFYAAVESLRFGGDCRVIVSIVQSRDFFRIPYRLPRFQLVKSVFRIGKIMP